MAINQQDQVETSNDDEAPALAAGSTSRRTMMKAALAGAAGSMVAGNLGAGSIAAQETSSPEAAGEGGAEGRPNIVMIMADDIGYWNISAYNLGMMGYQTPNIDRIAREGVQFTDAYGEQSCTAGRGAFITGQSPFRTGLLRVALPVEERGITDEDPTLAQMLSV